MTLSGDIPTQTNAAKRALVSHVILDILDQKTFSGTSLNKLQTSVFIFARVNRKKDLKVRPLVLWGSGGQGQKYCSIDQYWY